MLAAYSCGGSRGIGFPHRVPFYVPPHAGTDDDDYSHSTVSRKRAAKGAALTKGLMASLVAGSTVSQDESEQGTR